MFISAKPYRATLHHDSDAGCLLIFSCKALDDSGVLEIGNRYVFASRKSRGLFSRRRSCVLTVRLRRRISLSDTAIANLHLSSDRIGNLSFCPPMKADAGTTALTASLDASLFVDDKLFEELVSALHLRRTPESLQLDIEKEGVIKYGWEPDGSRKEWKTQDSSAMSEIDVTRISLMFESIA